MANQVNWQQMPGVGNPGAEIASISGMLSAIAEGREKRRQFEEEQAIRQQIADQNARHQQALEAHNAGILAQQQRKAQADAQAAQEKLAREQRETFAQKALPGAQAALRNDDVQGAKLAVQPYGGDVLEDTSGAEAAAAAQEQRRGAAFDRIAGKVPQLGIFDLMTLPVQAAEHAKRSAAPTPEEQAQAQKRYRIQGPVGEVLDYSPQEATKAEDTQFERNAGRVEKAASLAGVPFGGRAVSTGKAMSLVGATPEEALTRGLASAATGEQQAGSDRRAAMSAARATKTNEFKTVDDDRALSGAAESLLNQKLQREDYKVIVTNVRDNQMMIKLLESNNAAAHKRAMGIAAKQGSGPGAVTDSEREYFVNTVGGKDEKVKQLALDWLAGGEVPEQMREVFRNAYRDIVMKHQAEVLDGIREDVRETYSTHPNAQFHGYADWAANQVGRSILGPLGKGKKAAPAAEETRTVNGKTYVKKNGEWEEAD